MSVEKKPSELFPGCTEIAVFLDDADKDCDKETATKARILVIDANGDRVHEVYAFRKISDH